MARKRRSRKKKPSIEPLENGPYRLRGLERITGVDGGELETGGDALLCRCGGSARKPFCDGTHVRIGFVSARLTDGAADHRRSYRSRDGRLVVHDNRGICSHAVYCTSCGPRVWKMGVEPWIDPDGDSPRHIMEVIRMCPSGALSYTYRGKEHRDRDHAPALVVFRNGPYRLRGGVRLAGGVTWGRGASREHYTLCRCGASGNKPFCDGSHWRVGFHDQEAAPAEETRREWLKVANRGEVKEGEVKKVEAAGRELALLRIDGRHAVLDGRCAHMGGPLFEGSIEDGVLLCPWHGWGYDPFTGEDPRGVHAPVKAYPVEERGDGVYVQVEEQTAGRTVSDLMVQTMVNWGVIRVFGMVGFSILGLADAVRRRQQAGDLRFVGVRHEGAAAFACSGYAKLTGRPAACMTIAGPGATNLLTGLWDARTDRAPLLALTGQVKTQVVGPGTFQEIDLAAAFSDVTAFSQPVLRDSRHAELMSLALKHALVERDVAHLVFPDSVQQLPAPADAEPAAPRGRLGRERVAPDPVDVREAVARITAARRPAVIAGYGARGAMQEIIALAERLGAPVITTFKAKGQIPDTHPLATGVLGRSGTPVSSRMMNTADLLLVFGASFSEHTGIDPHKPTIQVDLDRMTLGRFHGVSLPVWGDAAVTARLIMESLPEELPAEDRRPEIAERWRRWRREKQRRARRNRGQGLAAAAVFDVLGRIAPDDTIFVVDVGDNTYAFGRYLESKSNQVTIMSGYLGSIGFAFPAAMGAWAAAPERPVIAVAGDGGFGQYLAEFTTAVKYGMSITVLVLNNGELGLISKEQRQAGWKRPWRTSLQNPDFSAYARNCGGFGARARDRRRLAKHLRQALAVEGPALVEVMNDAELE